MVAKTSKSKTSDKAGKASANGASASGLNGASASGAMKNLFQNRKRDIWIAFLFVFGIVSALSIYLNVTGAFGDLLVSVSGNIFGRLRYVMPTALIVISVLLVFPKGFLVSKLNQIGSKYNEKNAHDRDKTGKIGKIGETNLTALVFGLSLMGISIAGLLHISLDQPSLTPLSLPNDALQNAGGYFGAIVGIPLLALMASVASVIVLLGVGILGISIATSSTFSLWFQLIGILAKKIKVKFDKKLSNIPKRDSSVSAQSKKAQKVKNIPSPGIDALNGDPLITNQSTEKKNPAQKLFNGAKKSKESTPKVKEVKAETPTPPLTPVPPSAKSNLPKTNSAVEAKGNEKKTSLAKSPAPPKKNTQGWMLPSLDMLTRSGAQKTEQEKTRLVEAQSMALTGALEAHGVEATLTGWVVGPTVTRYELELDEGVKVSSITKLHKDIAYAMAAKDVRILAPIPGRKAIGIEVPNHDREIVLLGDNLASKEATEAKHPLDVALGKDINGTTIMLNLADTPHILIAGATGAGKSSCLNTAVTSILMRTNPDEVRLILIDPKMVEMRQFENAPHLLTPPVVDPKKAANALGWAVREMDRRYEVLFTAGFREIIGYNDAFTSGTLKPVAEGAEEYIHMPYIVVVVDELSDLMMVAAKNVEDYICRLAQKARAVGIHLIIATQRPSTDVITGVIKANVPARLAFSVSSLTDSRVILDQQGAERLVGQGDMLLRLPTMGTMTRIQGAWITEEEVKAIAEFWHKQKPEPDYIENVTEEVVQNNGFGGNGNGDGGDVGDDELYEVARDLVISSGMGSTSMLQRKLRVGFARAGRLMDMLEENEVVGPSEGSKTREVLIDAE